MVIEASGAALLTIQAHSAPNELGLTFISDWGEFERNRTYVEESEN